MNARIRSWSEFESLVAATKSAYGEEIAVRVRLSFETWRTKHGDGRAATRCAKIIEAQRWDALVAHPKWDR